MIGFVCVYEKCFRKIILILLSGITNLFASFITDTHTFIKLLYSNNRCIVCLQTRPFDGIWMTYHYDGTSQSKGRNATVRHGHYACDGETGVLEFVSDSVSYVFIMRLKLLTLVGHK